MTRKFLRVILFDAQMAILQLRVILRVIVKWLSPHASRGQKYRLLR